MATDKRPVVVRLRSGAEYGLRDAATARRIYPNGEIVRYQDGSAYVAEPDAPAVNLDGLTRDELNAYAGRVGVEDAASLPNKAAVIAAIEDAGA